MKIFIESIDFLEISKDRPEISKHRDLATGEVVEIVHKSGKRIVSFKVTFAAFVENSVSDGQVCGFITNELAKINNPDL